MNRTLIAAIGLAIVACAGCSSSSGGDKATSAAPSTSAVAAPFGVAGKVVVGGQSTITRDGEGTECWTLGNNPSPITEPTPTPYDDVKEGAQVVVSDASGKTLGIGELVAGVAGANIAVEGQNADYPCTFQFSVSGIKAGSEFYAVKVANQPPKQFTAAEIESPTIQLGTN